MTPTVPIPSRHPARLALAKSNDTTTQATNLTNEQLDVWEHATVLYHGFDWQTAAETFLFLSRTINRNLESTLCLLNAALVFSRCGEYLTASKILHEAEPNHQTLALTMFLMGHVEFELGKFREAEDSLKFALHSLNGSNQRFDHLGLEFVLRASHIQQSLRTFDTKNDLVGMLGTLGALPADGVFEAPSRNQATVASNQRPSMHSRSSTDSGMLPTLTDRSSPSAPASPIESVISLEYGSDGMRWRGLPEDPDVHVSTPTRPSSIYKAMQTPTVFERMLGEQARPATTKAFSPFSKVLPAFRRTRQSGLEPREARVRGDSVRGLANFIRTLPSQNKTMQPKEAKVKDDSTMTLADFFRTSGPDDAAAQVPHDNASDRSVYSDNSGRAESVRSADLRNLVDDDKEYSEKYRATPPPPSQHPYRISFGSMLMQENMPNAARRRTNQNLETTAMNSDALHNRLCDADNVSMDWHLTNEASSSLRGSFVSAASSRTELPLSRAPLDRADVPQPLRLRDAARAAPPAIPGRGSSLLPRQNTTRGARPASTVSSSRFFSHVANLR